MKFHYGLRKRLIKFLISTRKAMEKIISIFNFKNGVGKTTIGYALAKHLECDFIEAEPEYLKNIDENEKQAYSKEIHDYFIDIDKNRGINDNEIFKNIYVTDANVKIYDINTADTKKIKEILIKSNIIIIPTFIDFKDISKTISALKFINDIEKKNKLSIKVVVTFNKLNADKSKELTLTYNSEQLLKKYRNQIIFNYIRESRFWYRGFFKGDCYLDFFKKEFYYHKINEDPIFALYFTNNQILEIFYQYAYYYNTYYSAFENAVLEKKIKKTSKQTRKEIARENMKIDNKNIEIILNSRKFFILTVIATNALLKGISTTSDKTINKIATNILKFKKVDSKSMISFDNKLLNEIQKSRVYYDVCFDENKYPIKSVEEEKAYDKTYQNARIETNRYYKIIKKYNSLRDKEIITILKELDEKTYDYSKMHDEAIDIKDYNFLFFKEKIIHLYLSTLFNLQNVNAGRKIFRDMRDLLISIEEYSE